MNKKTIFTILILSIFIGSACNSVYRKHYSNGFTFLKHSNKTNKQSSKEGIDIQKHSIAVLENHLIKERAIELSKAENSFQTIHRHFYQADASDIKKEESKKQVTASSKPTKFKSIDRKILKRMVPNKKAEVEVAELAKSALILSLVSMAFFILVPSFAIFTAFPFAILLGLLSMPIAIISLVLARKAKHIAELEGIAVPPNLTIAKLLSWIVIGFNIMALFLLILIVILLVSSPKSII